MSAQTRITEEQIADGFENLYNKAARERSELKAQVAELEAQRGALVEACKGIVAGLRMLADCGSEPYPAIRLKADAERMAEQAEQAIAQATGQGDGQ